METQRPVGAIVLAAGLGTRMKSERAKVLHPLGGRPLISYPLAALRRIDVDPIVVVVGYQAEAVRDACKPYAPKFALQTEQRGTGHATRAARAALRGFDGDLLLVYGDLPFLRPETFRRLIAAHQRAQARLSLLTATVKDPVGFGRIVRDPRGRVARIVEDRDCSVAERGLCEINVGLYCAAADFLFDILEHLKPGNAQRELYLTDIVALAAAQGARIADARAAAREGAQISSRADLAAREKTLREEINDRWMAAGVTLDDPATAYIGPDVQIGRDTVIGPNVVLRGRTRIGRRCRVDGSAFITDATVGNDVHLKFCVVLTGAMVADQAQVGPFAQLRPGTRLGPGVHVGDFVETKNAVVGAGTKAMHLAYLGDTEIGEHANIGAGTITCNYDGFHKHRTVIGDRVQVGSDSQLVAPVTVGHDAYVATGTTVRQDVAPGALVFNAKDERQHAGWVTARRAREAARADLPSPARSRARGAGRTKQAVPGRGSAGAVTKRSARSVARSLTRRKRQPKRR
ncbi:MAG: bifunctional UDP-N-acetylglucosamine diphosphorylase/glucosamine-1-phosphate N-acetyltransferase GlmU [Candidatus Binatia bacterium]